MGWFSSAGGKTNSRAEDIKISIFDRENKLLEEGQGNWLSHISFGTQSFWKIDSDLPEDWEVANNEQLLESDSSIREDLHAIAAKDWE